MVGSKNSKKTIVLVLAVICIGILSGAPAANAQFWASPWIGKGTGSYVTLSCSYPLVAIGYTVRSGWVVDNLSLQCARLGPNGEHQSVTSTNFLHASTGGQPSTVACPSGKVMVGVKGRAKDVIDRIQVGCKSWSRGQGTYGSVSWTSAAGGTGGETYGPLLCTGSTSAVNIKGRTGQYLMVWVVGGFNFHCEERKLNS